VSYPTATVVVVVQSVVVTVLDYYN